MRILSLSLENIGPFDKAELEFVSDPEQEKAPVTLITGENGAAIRPRNGSAKGRETIRKYKLDRAELDLKRSRMLRLLTETVVGIFRKMNTDGRQVMTIDEKEVLQSFCQPEHPFSLMFTVQLEGLRL
jgi:hypothetical protein